MICFLCCNIYKKEIEAISGSEDFKGVKTFFFNASCWNGKDIKSRLRTQILKVKEQYPGALIEIITCSPCLKNRKGKRGLIPENNKIFFDEQIISNCNFVSFDNVNHLFTSKTNIDNYISQNAYLLTPGWLLKWKAHLIEWGFDKKTAGEFFRESVKKLVLLDTGVSRESSEKLKEFACYLDLPYEVVYTGLDFFKLNIGKIINDSKNKIVKKELQKKFLKANKIAADYAMAMDIISSISNISEENKIIKKILELFVQIFGAKRINYLQLFSEKKGQLFSYPDSDKNIEEEVKVLEKFSKNYEILPEKNGFLINISFSNNKLGVLEVADIPSSENENLNQFLNLSLVISNVFSLAISNAREYRALEKSRRKYKFMSFHDGLTGLYNRAYFEEEIKRLNSDIERFRPIAVLSADVNWLKETNDKMGHESGDILIIGCSKILSSSVRKTDILARIGGDEFCVILPKADEIIVLRIIDQIRKKEADFNKDPLNIKKNIKISIALGFDVSKTSTSKDIYDTLKNSDKKMYKNKSEIKNDHLFIEE
jgi:diguanylate cyclase (GGDEF)-like protein